MNALPHRVSRVRVRCACCGFQPPAGPMVVVAGESYCVGCERAIRSAPTVALTPEARAFVRRVASRRARAEATS